MRSEVPGRPRPGILHFRRIEGFGTHSREKDRTAARNGRFNLDAVVINDHFLSIRAMSFSLARRSRGAARCCQIGNDMHARSKRRSLPSPMKACAPGEGSRGLAKPVTRLTVRKLLRPVPGPEKIRGKRTVLRDKTTDEYFRSATVFGMLRIHFKIQDPSAHSNPAFKSMTRTAGQKRGPSLSKRFEPDLKKSCRSNGHSICGGQPALSERNTHVRPVCMNDF